MNKNDKYKSNIFDNSKLEENIIYSKKEVIEDIKNQKVSMLPKGILFLRSKGLFGFILWTFLSFKLFGYKYSTIKTPPSLSIGLPMPGTTIILNPEQSLIFTFVLISLYLLIWFLFYFDKKNNLNK